MHILSLRELPSGVYTVTNSKLATTFEKYDNDMCRHVKYTIMNRAYDDYKHIVTPEEFDLLAEGKTIQAIKLYRERTKCGLKLAKDIIDVVRNS